MMINVIRRGTASFAGAVLIFFGLGSASAEDIDTKKLLAQPNTYVGSEVCRSCHLEHYDAWKRTLHSRMLQDAKANADVLVTDIVEEKVRADLALKGDKLKVPADQIHVPKQEDVLYTIGSQWKQRYLIRHEGKLKIAPTQFNVDSGKWVNYHEHDWEKRPWLKKCGGCHATGVDLEKDTFLEPGVGCEACHGKGSWHAALPKARVHQKRETIVNPGKLTLGVGVQICGSCHNRGKSTQVKGSSWPVGYEPGKSLEAFYRSTSYEGGDVKHVYANEFAKGHHQQYLDWKQSKHHKEGVTCMSCHYSHELGAGPRRSQTLSKGSKTCMECHVQVSQQGAHGIHSFANCTGCHMPRIAKSAESGDIRSHVFVTLLPKDTLENPKIPNSCQTCHRHKNEDLEDLQRRYDELTKRTPKASVAMATESVDGAQ